MWAHILSDFKVTYLAVFADLFECGLVAVRDNGLVDYGLGPCLIDLDSVKQVLECDDLVTSPLLQSPVAVRMKVQGAIQACIRVGVAGLEAILMVLVIKCPKVAAAYEHNQTDEAVKKHLTLEASTLTNVLGVSEGDARKHVSLLMEHITVVDQERTCRLQQEVFNMLDLCVSDACPTSLTSKSTTCASDFLRRRHLLTSLLTLLSSLRSFSVCPGTLCGPWVRRCLQKI